MELKEEEFEKFFSKFTEKLVNISDYWSEIEKFLSEYFNYCFDAVQRFLSWLKDLLIGNKELFKTSAEGFMAGAIRNALHYSVKLGGRASNIVTVFDKTVRSSLGNPTWFARVDRPHGNVPYHHINVNPKITGVPDPHIQISPRTAELAGEAGKVLKLLNQIAPYLAAVLVAFEAYDIGTEIKKDFDHESCRNVVTKVLIKILTSLSGLGGAAAGAAIGTSFFPGIGTMVGNLFGGMIGAPVVVVAANIETRINDFFDLMKFDIDSIRCEQCFRTFENRRYEEGRQKLCRCCRHWTVASR